MTSLERGVSNLSISSSESPRWFPRPTEKCRGEFYSGKVDLIVNWFRFSKNILDREIFEYELKLEKVINKRNGKIRKSVMREEKSPLFWEFMRKEFRNRPNNVQSFVYDDFDTVYTCEKNPNVIKSGLTINKKDYEMELRFRGSFKLKFSVEDFRDIDIVDRSNRFLKNLFTQKFRYSSNFMNEEFQKFLPYKNSIHLIPTASDDPKIKVAPGIEAWLGIYMGVRETMSGEPVLNFGLVNSLFYNVPSMNLIDYFILITIKDADKDEIRENYKKRLHSGEYGMDRHQRNKATKLLKDLKMRTKMAWDDQRDRFVERHFTFVEFSDETPDSFMIKLTKKRAPPISCTRLYEQNNQPIAYRKLPLIRCKSGKNMMLVPIEVLEVDNKPQKFKNLLDANMKQTFIKGATRDPHIHKDYTEKMLDMFDFQNPNLNFLEAFNISPTMKMIECKGKVLNEPNLVNKNSDKIKMTNTIRGFQEKSLNIVPQGELSVAVFVLRNDESAEPCLTQQEAGEFYKEFIDICIERGIRVEQNENIYGRSLLRLYDNVSCFNGPECFQVAAEHAKNHFESLEDKKDKELLFLMLHDRNFDAYGHMKHICDHVLGVANQVVDAATVRKACRQTKESPPSRRIFYNIALKVNGKLNGVNQELGYCEEQEVSPEMKEKLNTEPLTMYVGIDVTHPTQNSGIDISIASIVASINRGATRYRNKIIAQMEKPAAAPPQPGQRISRERMDVLDGKFEPLLAIFAENNKNRIPDKIVVFRDGVSDSEMLKTAHDELVSLKKEVTNFIKKRGGDEKEPLYSYIVIQKRHHTRLYRKSNEEKDMKDSQGTGIVNITSGTVCDKEIVSKYKFDFWLASHHGALGTSRPCHYTVLYDNSGLTMDTCYKMCYELAFLSFRVRKPISLPAPVHYAHLSCEKAKESYKSMKMGRIPYGESKEHIEKYLQPNIIYPGMSFI